MQSPIELANKILALLEKEDSRDALNALRIAKILLPIKPNPVTARLLSEGQKVHAVFPVEVQ